MSTEKPDPADEIRTRALERARAIATAYIDAKGDLGPYKDEYLRDTAMALAAAFHAAGDGLHEEADATVERRKKGWQSLSKEFHVVAARMIGIAWDLAELAKLDEIGDFEPSARTSITPSLPAGLQPGDELVVAVAGTIRDLETGQVVGEFEPTLSAKICNPFTAATDPVTSQEDVRAYLAGDTDAMPASLAPEQEDRLIEHAERLTAEAGNEVGAPGIPVHPTWSDVAYVVNGKDVTHQVVSDTLPPVVAALDESIEAGASEPWAPGEREALISDDVTRAMDPSAIDRMNELPEFAVTLQFEDPAPIAAQFQREPFPGASKQRVTFEHLMTPVQGSMGLLLPEHWSWSQLTSAEDCGVSYRLGRLEGVRQQPQWANVGGKAFHNVTEIFDRAANTFGGADRMPEPVGDLIRQRWEAAFAAAIAETAAASGIEMGEEGANWRASKQGKENYTWWLVEGEQMLARYVKLRRQLDKAGRAAGTLTLPLMLGTPSTPDVPVIEYAYERPVPGPTGVLMVKGVIDRAYRCVDGSIIIKDLKSGSGKGDSGQLGEYAWALVHLIFNQYPRPGADVDLRIRGCFYDARDGIFTEPIDLLGKPNHPDAEYVYRYHTAEMHRRAGLYSPRKSPYCNGCSVKHACPIGGAQ